MSRFDQHFQDFKQACASVNFVVDDSMVICYCENIKTFRVYRKVPQIGQQLFSGELNPAAEWSYGNKLWFYKDQTASSGYSAHIEYLAEYQEKLIPGAFIGEIPKLKKPN